MTVAPGLVGSVEHRVDERSTALSMVSGTVPVLGTPELVRLMEAAAVTALEGRLPADSTTVGVYIAAHHTAPTPIGLTVRVTATVTEVEGRRIRFNIVAHDDVEQVGHAVHERVIVNVERFMSGAARKAAARL
jgi:fluoroacetyl-CoA thioesterase